MSRTQRPLELAWLLLSLVGMCWCWWLWRDATRTRHYWEAEGVNGGVEINTRNNVRSSGIRTAKAGLFVASGIIRLFLPAPVYPGTNGTPLTRLPMALMAVAAALNTVDAILARRSRQQAITAELRSKRIEITEETQL